MGPIGGAPIHPATVTGGCVFRQQLERGPSPSDPIRPCTHWRWSAWPAVRAWRLRPRAPCTGRCRRRPCCGAPWWWPGRRPPGARISAGWCPRACRRAAIGWWRPTRWRRTSSRRAPRCAPAGCAARAQSASRCGWARRPTAAPWPAPAGWPASGHRRPSAVDRLRAQTVRSVSVNTQAAAVWQWGCWCHYSTFYNIVGKDIWRTEQNFSRILT